MGCRLPGDIDSPDLFWKTLVQGRDCVTRIPDARWERMVEHLHPDQRPAAPFPAGVIDHRFDHEFFGISADEAAEMDPQQGWILEVAHEALADAGIAPSSLAGSRAGVYVGAASIDQAATNFAAGRRAGVFTGSGAGMAILANRLSYVLDIDGPSLVFDTACSSSLTALHYAVRDLRSGDVDLALVAGTNILTNPAITAGFIESGVLSADRCAPFDQDADGYVRSEGTVVLVLTRTDVAVERGHRVWAHVVGTAIGHGGRAPHLLAPRATRQTATIRRALADAALPPSRIRAVEGHATATRSGDRVEAEAVAEALGHDVPVLIGSVKSTVGHLEGAAGTAGAPQPVHRVQGTAHPGLRYRAPRPSGGGLGAPDLEPRCARHWDCAPPGSPRRLGGCAERTDSRSSPPSTEAEKQNWRTAEAAGHGCHSARYTRPYRIRRRSCHESSLTTVSLRIRRYRFK
jgi:acyl transferase domain-containing protein